MTWLWLMVGLVALVLVLTSIPIHVEFAVTSSPRWQGHTQLEWGRWLRLRWPLFDAAGLPKQSEPRPEGVPKTEPFSKRPRDRGRPRSKAPAFSLQAVPHLVRFARRLLRQTRIGRLHVQLRVGCDNPADTGMLFGALAPLHPLLSQTDVWLEPCFWESCFEGQAEGRVTFVPLRYLVVLVWFALSPRTWRLGREGLSP